MSIEVILNELIKRVREERENNSLRLELTIRAWGGKNKLVLWK
jgi:hypothetical protein